MIEAIFAYVGFAATLGGMVWFLFEKAEELLPNQQKERLIMLLRGDARWSLSTSWPPAFLALFDSVFGKRTFSRKRFARSALASVVTLFCAYLLWAAFALADRSDVIASASLHTSMLLYVGTLAAAILLSSSINVIIDYFSLVQTRFLLGILAQSPSFWLSILFLVIDVVLTATIFFVGVFLILYVCAYLVTLCILGYMVMLYFTGNVFPEVSGDFSSSLLAAGAVKIAYIAPYEFAANIIKNNAIQEAFNMAHISTTEWVVQFEVGERNSEEHGHFRVAFFINDGPSLLSPYLYTCFFTSVWSILFVVCAAAIRMIGRFGQLLRPLVRALDVERAPLRSVGYVATCLTVLLVLAIGPLFLASDG